MDAPLNVKYLDARNRFFSEGKIDYVFHLAAYATEGLSHFIKKFNYENNLMGSVNLISADVKHLITGQRVEGGISHH